MPINSSMIITDIGGEDSNSYVSFQYFVEYADRLLNMDVFLTSSSDDKVRSLLMSAQRLDRENWVGSPVQVTQSLAWPRNDVKRPDPVQSYNLSYWNDNFRSDEIPDLVSFAQCELAIAYLNGFEEESEREIDSFVSDGISVKYSKRSRDESNLPLRVARLISGLIRGNKIVRA
jgi:hypothetical protein